MSSLLNRFYDRLRHGSAQSVQDDPHVVHGFQHLSGHKYCVLVTYKRSGQSVPTPVWFGLRDGKAYVRSEAAAAKVRRIRNDPRVRIAPCTVRGKPLGAAAEGRARVLDDSAEQHRAEAALRRDYGIGRRLYQLVFGRLGAEMAYLEIVPS